MDDDRLHARIRAVVVAVVVAALRAAAWGDDETVLDDVDVDGHACVYLLR